MVAQILYEEGTRFNRWTVLRRGNSTKYGLEWICKCDCGREREVQGTHLRNGSSPSCGCSGMETIRKVHWKGHQEIGANLWNSFIRGATSRNLAFELTIEEVWLLFIKQDRRCALTGLPLEMFSFKTNHREYSNMRGGQRGSRTNGTASLDRIDSSKGYIRGNVQWIHKTINVMKLDHSQDEFVRLCGLVTAHNTVDPKRDVL